VTGELMKRFLFSIAWMFTVVVAFAACAEKTSVSGLSQPRTPRANTATDYASLLDGLRAAGATVEPAGEVEQPFLSVTGTMIKVHGEDVQVFEYANPAAMEAETAKISRDGSTVGTAKLHWIGSPHFHRRGKLLVLYLGDSEQVLKTLQSVLGDQFAGQ
jgi:hypothetical protein